MKISVKNRKKSFRKGNIALSIFGNIITFIFVSAVVLAIFMAFVAYVLTDIYDRTEKESSMVSDIVEEHIGNNKETVEKYANSVGKSWARLLYIEGQLNENDIASIMEIIKDGSDFEYMGWVLTDGTKFGSFCHGEDIKVCEFYKRAMEGEFGISVEKIGNTNSIIYTSPIIINGETIAIAYATESGRLNHFSFKFVNNDDDNDARTGISACYLVDEKDESIFHMGNSQENFDYNSLSAKLMNNQSEDGIYSVEYAETMLGMNRTSEKIFSNFFEDYNVYDSNEIDFSEALEEGRSLQLSKVWYKKKLDIETLSGNTLYSLMQADVYVESTIVSNLIFVLIFTVFILMVPFWILFISTITRIISNRKMARLLYMDELTGYGNWTHFEKEARKTLKKRSSREKKFAMISFEVNKYRIVLDYYGEGFEKEILSKISDELNTRLDKDECFARYAESQYAVLMTYVDEDILSKRVAYLLKVLANSMADKHISFRAGIYLIEDKTMPVKTMNLIAGGAKDTGKSGLETQVVMYNSEIHDKQVKEKILEDSMEQALKNEEFKVYLQPKYNPRNNELAGAEALVRWISPEKGFICPGEFIPLFEKNGFIAKLDDYMLDKVAAIQEKWMKQGRKMVPISVNISRVHFANVRLAEHIQAIVDKYDVPHEYIELELTESAFFDDKSLLTNTVKRLHDFGFLVSMDDFGAGYSSLNSLKDIPLDIIKLDGEFFHETEEKNRGETVVRNTITMAKNLNMKIVAEGIETKEQVEFLESQGCDLIQGFYYAKPMPISEFEMLDEIAKDK